MLQYLCCYSIFAQVITLHHSGPLSYAWCNLCLKAGPLQHSILVNYEVLFDVVAALPFQSMGNFSSAGLNGLTCLMHL